MSHDTCLGFWERGHVGEYNIFFMLLQTGTMRVGDDVLVLTQCEQTRSIGFLSKSYNKGKDVRIPINSF